jgi:ephrin type-B receptor 2, putative
LTSIPRYEVKYYPKNSERNVSTIITNKQEVLITNLKHKTDYGFQVRRKSIKGWTDYSKPIFQRTGQFNTAYIAEDDSAQVRIIAGVCVAIVVFIVVAIVMIVLYLRR